MYFVLSVTKGGFTIYFAYITLRPEVIVNACCNAKIEKKFLFLHCIAFASKILQTRLKTYHLHFSAVKIEGAECTSCWTPFVCTRT